MSTRKRKRNNASNRERTVTTFTEDPNTCFLVPLASEDPPPFSMQQFYQPVLPPGKNDLEILENLKNIIKEGQHEFYRAEPQPAALASLYMGHISQPDDSVEPNTSPPPESEPPPEPDSKHVPADTNTPPDTPKAAPLEAKDEQDTVQEHTADVESPALAPNADTRQDNRFYDRDRDRDRFADRERGRDWERDRDRHDPLRDRSRDIRDRRPEFFGRSYGRSHAPRPPPELRHYEPSYGDDYVPPPRRFDPDDRRGALRTAPHDDRFKPPFDDRRPPVQDRRPPPADNHPTRPGPDARFPPAVDDRARPEPVPLARTTADVDRGPRATSLASDERPRATVPLEERLSQPAPPSLQDRLSQPTNVPARVDMPAPTLEERLSLGPAPRYRAPSVARDDHRLAKDDRDHDRMPDFRRDLSREERPPASSYRPDLDRFGERDERERRDRDADVVPARLEFPRPVRRYSPPPPPVLDRERERARPYYPTRSPPPIRDYHPDGDKRYPSERERDAYERRREWYPEDDKRAAPPPASWRPHERPFVDRERFDRDRERERPREVGPPPAAPTRAHWDERERRFPSPPPRMDATDGPRSLSARLTDAYPPPSTSNDDRAYGQREFERGRYGMDDHHGPPPFTRVRHRSPTPPRRGPLADDLRPPLKRVREENAGYAGAAYSPPRREYVPGPPPSTTATATSVASVSGLPNTTSAFYDREREREREYVRGEYGGYDRARRSPPRMGPGYVRAGRDDRRYVPPPPRTT